MRFLPHLFAALIATTTLTTQVASACGDYVERNPAPRVLVLATHSVGTVERPATRAFVVLEQSIDSDDNGSAWSWLVPHLSYDTTHIMKMARLAKPIEVTLVGPNGTRIVKTDKQVALSRDWHIGFDQKRVALEVPVRASDRFEIAIAGRVADAKWHELDASASTRWWLNGQGGLAADATPLGALTANGRTYVVYSQNRQIGLVEVSATALTTLTKA